MQPRDSPKVFYIVLWKEGTMSSSKGLWQAVSEAITTRKDLWGYAWDEGDLKGYEQGQDFKEKNSLSPWWKDLPSLSIKQRWWRWWLAHFNKLQGPFTFNLSHNQFGRHFTDGDNIWKMSLNPSDKATIQTQIFDLLTLFDLLGGRNTTEVPWSGLKKRL